MEVEPKLYRTNDSKFLQGDSTKAKETLGWTPKCKYKDIVKLMVRNELAKKEAN